MEAIFACAGVGDRPAHVRERNIYWASGGSLLETNHLGLSLGFVGEPCACWLADLFGPNHMAHCWVLETGFNVAIKGPKHIQRNEGLPLGLTIGLANGPNKMETNDNKHE